MMMEKIDMKRLLPSTLTARPEVIQGYYLHAARNAEKALRKIKLAKQASLGQVTFPPQLPLGEGLGKLSAN